MVKQMQETIPILGDPDKEQGCYGTSSNTEKNKWRSNQLTYPKAVIFVLLSKFFEAFAANGVRTVLALYLRDELDFSEKSATSFYHVFNFFSQFCPIIGAVLADSYFGNVKTIFYIFFIYACGWIGTVALTFPLKNLPTVPLVISSLILISIGNGSIRACITSLGGSQFKEPEQTTALNRYFSHYYLVYTLGIFLSKIIPPEIRANTQCFDKNICYTIVFGSLSGVFLVAWLIFLIGMCLYKREEVDESEGNVLFKVIGCVYYGIKCRFSSRFIPSITNNSWIDGAAEKYSEEFVEDVSIFLKIMKLFMPLPIYWALFAQIDSTWTFQSSELDTTVFGFKFEADQAKAVGALLLIALIPLWEKVITPALSECNVRISPLKSMLMGGISAAVSFVCAGILQLAIESDSHQKISILWQLPQFFLIMIGEVWLSIPGLAFSFTQSPPWMKSVMLAAWFCLNAFGNLIVVVITKLHIFKADSSTYFLYAFLMFGAMFVFSYMVKYYRYARYADFSDRNGNTLKNSTNTHSTRSLDLIF